MEKKDVIKALSQVAKEEGLQVNFDKTKGDTKLEDLGIDSIAGITMVVKTEEVLNVKVDDAKLQDMKTMDDLINAFLGK